MDVDVLAPLVALLAAAASIRVTGQRVAHWVVTWVGYRLRQHDDRAPLSTVRIRSHTGALGAPLGMAAIGDTWTAVVRLTGPATDLGTALRALRAAYGQSDIPLVSAQLVVWTGTGERVCWLAVRYRTADAPLATLVRGGGERGAQRATVAAALAVSCALTEAGCPNTVLTADELSADLVLALGAPEEPAGTGEPVESWRHWAGGGVPQVCFRPPSGLDPVRLLGTVVPGAAFTTTSLTLRRLHSGAVREELLLRLGLRPAAGDEGAVAGIGVPLVPLHGRHRPYVRRTLPLAL
ncbi:type VII secretion protein EccE [Qaidamihabitans albus]|uniref:type VII secretion protein EccE n=1 Tax=Qaidamihabitans albus TaxID=2795733 RepID=UPI0018F21CEE|nr:type VII secretion protein EccE [Qaidamihabitans albus]